MIFKDILNMSGTDHHPRMQQEYRHNYHNDTDDDDEYEEEEEEVARESEEEECKGGRGRRLCVGWSGKVLDPRASRIQEWNRVFLLVSAAGLFLDPLFFYTISISENCMCIFVDGWFALTVTVLRCMTDALHVCNMWLQFKLVNRNRRSRPHSLSDVDDERSSSSPRKVALRYIKDKKGFFFDLFVILPLPQVRHSFYFFIFFIF